MAGLVTTTASPLYCASKAGVLAYLRSHGPEYQRTNNVRMVAVCPSLTDTPLIRSTDSSDHLFKLHVQRGLAHKRGWTAHLSVRNEVTEARGGCCRTGVGGGVRASRISSHHLPRPLLLLARHKPRVVQPLLPRLSSASRGTRSGGLQCVDSGLLGVWSGLLTASGACTDRWSAGWCRHSGPVSQSHLTELSRIVKYFIFIKPKTITNCQYYLITA